MIDWDKLIKNHVVNRIKWKFIPPASPWWGGFWERMIGLMKNILRKVLGNASLKYEELYTILCDCENILNCRPLTYISEDLELEPLTPAMFFRDLKESGVPDLDIIDAKYLQKRYAYQMKVREDLRKRFRTEYLGQLKNHILKTEKYVKLSVGDIVLIETPEKRIKWPLGKIITLIPGNDGVVRLVKLRTKSGEILRPIQRIYPLEVHLQTDNIGDCLRKKHSDQKMCDKPTTSIGSTEFRATDKDQSDELNQNPLKTTRCGRVIRTPERLNLMNFQPDCG
ncbi:uncharacterized protein LOC118196434 [Stegodyphus dumicola]|uniref:uncharacterized protein LOC118196434 n=2 Tax=Stegodyphus dumicola TaxID=202533 RepID=UPI0015AF4551|nr:uncharacterized protein LOC118196434 [Stegodyphus dumicola]